MSKVSETELVFGVPKYTSGSSGVYNRELVKRVRVEYSELRMDSFRSESGVLRTYIESD